MHTPNTYTNQTQKLMQTHVPTLALYSCGATAVFRPPSGGSLDRAFDGGRTGLPSTAVETVSHKHTHNTHTHTHTHTQHTHTHTHTQHTQRYQYLHTCKTHDSCTAALRVARSY